MRKRLRACLLGSLLVTGPVASPHIAGGLVLSAGLAGYAGEAWAQSRSSGGYSRPSGRTPSFGGSGGYARPRTPSSGGYSLPQSSGRRPSVTYGGSSAGDRGYSRAQSADALRRMRDRQDQDAARAAAPSYSRPSSPAPSPAPSSGGGFGLPTGGYGGGYRNPAGGRLPTGSTGGWYRDRGWSPGGILGGPRSFGIWDAAFMWFLFSTLSQPGHSDFFRNHQDDPGYREWRQEAERRAQTDAETRSRLDELDRRIAQGGDQPRDPNYLPPGVPPEIATGRADPSPPDRRTPGVAVPDEAGGGISFSVIIVVLGGGAALAFLAWRRSRLSSPTTGSRGGSTMGTAGTIRSAGGMLRHKASGEAYVPSRFRVGMTLTIDPTPFLLAAGATHLPDIRQGSGTVSVTEVGRIGGDAPGGLVRLYLPDDGAMLQLHLGPGNEPDECRYFAPIDQITPADEAEWGAWLDPQEGMIGWPEFQTKDGKVYARIWSPGSSRVEPRLLVEQVESATGTRTVQSQAMLYGAPTGLAAPAPQTEYILVAATEDAGQAWIEVRAGLDINPASLSLA